MESGTSMAFTLEVVVDGTVASPVVVLDWLEAEPEEVWLASCWVFLEEYPRLSLCWAAKPIRRCSGAMI